jgi:organic radical activating enzyme
MMRLDINEVFTSINGEVSPCKQGSIATFIRMGYGCNLTCAWCDTPNHSNKNLTVYADNDNVYRTLVAANGGPLAKNITITGGEPLKIAFTETNGLKAFNRFLQILCSNKHIIAIETNGTYPLPESTRSYVHGFVVDYKFFLLDDGWKIDKAFAAMKDLKGEDYVKLVLDKVHHIGLAKQFLSYYTSLVDPECLPTFAVSIVNDGKNHFLDPAEVMKSFADDGYDILLNVQIHKFLKVP